MKRFHRCPRLLLAAPFWLLASIAVTAQVAVPAIAPANHVISIAEARKLGPGTKVTIDGSSRHLRCLRVELSDQGLRLQDRSAGIYISTPTNLNLAPRQQARVSGVLKDQSACSSSSLPDTAAVKPHGAGPRIEPQPIKTVTVGEATEGRIVHGARKITQAGERWPIRLQVLSQRRLEKPSYSSTSRPASHEQSGARQSVTVAASAPVRHHYEINPRSPDDIVKATP